MKQFFCDEEVSTLCPFNNLWHSTSSIRLPLAALAACDHDNSKHEASKSPSPDPANQVSKSSSFPRQIPGQYEVTTTTSRAKRPGRGNTSIVAIVDPLLGKAQAGQRCLLADEIKNDRKDILIGLPTSCTFDSFEVAGPSVKYAISCTTADCGNMVIKRDANITEHSMQSADFSQITMPGQTQPSIITSTTSMKRIGECPHSAQP